MNMRQTPPEIKSVATNRRMFLLGAACLGAAVATPAATQAYDPAVESYNEWRIVRAEYERVLDSVDGDQEEAVALFERDCEAQTRLATAVPTTPRGLACQIEYMREEFEAYLADFTGGIERDLLANMLAGAKEMAI